MYLFLNAVVHAVFFVQLFSCPQAHLHVAVLGFLAAKDKRLSCICLSIYMRSV